MLTKEWLRKNILKKRNRLTREETIERSRMIFCRVKAMREYQASRIVMAYMSFGSEVPTDEFITECIGAGKKVAVPSVIGTGTDRRIVPCEINDLKEELKVGTYGIREPAGDALPLKDNAMIDMVMVPGVVFGRNMHRIGYGKGYYDRFLRGIGNAKCVRVGVCFGMQLIDEIPAQSHDVPLDVIVMEDEVIKGRQQ